jgi:hypothetical protein
MKLLGKIEALFDMKMANYPATEDYPQEEPTFWIFLKGAVGEVWKIPTGGDHGHLLKYKSYQTFYNNNPLEIGTHFKVVEGAVEKI